MTRPSADVLLETMRRGERPKLRVYLGAAAGVGKTYQMLLDAHLLRRQGVDVVLAYVEPHARPETEALTLGLDMLPPRLVDYKGVTLREMDVDAVIARKPDVAIVDELAHTNVPGSRFEKRWQDVLALLDAGVSVITAVNVQHIETLNDVVAQATGVTVRETVPDTVLQRADEIVNVDVSIDTLRTRLRQGKIYPPGQIEPALHGFFRHANLSTLRELALRQVAQAESQQSRLYRAREGREPASMPEKVMVCMASYGSARTLLRTGARIAGRLSSDWYAVYVETAREEPGRISPEHAAALSENIRFARELGAQVVRLQGERVADALIAFARREGITHVVFGQSARSRWHMLVHGSILNRFLRDVKGATVQVVPQASG